jgi:hypothetical protein
VNKARLIFVAVMVLLLAQALFLAFGAPTGYFDGNG